MRRIFLIAGLLTALLPLAAEAGARVERRYYDVRASTAADLASAITSRSPLGVTAMTELARMEVRPHARRVAGGYVVDSLAFDPVIVQTFPRWVDRDRARPCLQRDWDRAMAALIRHEETHRRRYEQYLARLRQEAMALPPQPSPAALQRALSALVARLQAETNAWQQDYDRRTHYGRLEGVVIRDC